MSGATLRTTVFLLGAAMTVGLGSGVLYFVRVFALLLARVCSGVSCGGWNRMVVVSFLDRGVSGDGDGLLGLAWVLWIQIWP
ncbi:hypothetical protein A2U01_0053135, partial [Trifolium medium]|nr:hypothetical protein [Trifolium medium]